MLGTNFVEFIKYFYFKRNEVNNWEKKLLLISEIINELLSC